MTLDAAFEQACRYLFRRTSSATGTDWSLAPTRALLADLGHPERHVPVLHVAGTNGKGSVAAMCYEALRADGLRVGLYTSPHLRDVRERFVVDDVPMSKDAFVMWTDRLHHRIDEIGATFFEATTVMAVADFAARGVDLAVVETGLGGRLDATTTLEARVTAVTSIGLDHTEYLGDTLEDIAREKAGVARPGVPLVVGETDPGVVRVLGAEAERRGAVVTVIPPGRVFDGPVGMPGAHQRRNATVAEVALDLLPAAWRPDPASVRVGIARARLAGRLQRHGPWLFDVAHNPPGIDALVATLRDVALRRPLHAIVGALPDKPVASMARRVTEVADRVWLTDPRSAPVDRAVKGRGRQEQPPPDVLREPDLDRAMAAALSGAGTVLVTGSFYLVSDVMARLPGLQGVG